MAVELHTLPARCRHRFPIFEQRVYVNSCSQGALSDAVRASYDAYLNDWDEEGAPWEYWVERTEAARATFAKLINAAPEEIAVTTSLSAGVAALASGLRFAGPRFTRSTTAARKFCSQIISKSFVTIRRSLANPGVRAHVSERLRN